MTSTEHFDLTVDGSISPKYWLQQRLVATTEVLSVSRSYPPSGGGNRDDLMQSLVVSWTNDTPITQNIMGLVTRGGAVVSLQARSRGYLASFNGYEITATALPKPPADLYEMIEVSRFGTGMDVGKGGLLAVGTGYAISEKRQESKTSPFMAHSPGMIRIESGQTLHARVEIRFRTEFWENTSIDGGSSSTGSLVITGDTRIDLWAFPALVDPGPRLPPTIVGAVTWDREITSDLSVAKPTGTAAGDIILAFMFNQWGAANAFAPLQTGWIPLNALTAGFNDVHFALLWRLADGTEPANFTFENGFIAEGTVALMTVRGASTMLDDGWYVSSVKRKKWWERDDGHIAPSINRNGQLLICFSGIAYSVFQAPITQTPPTGMTEVLEVSGTASGVAIATLPSPPRPTGARTFITSKKPVWTGHSITLSLLVPGARP